MLPGYAVPIVVAVVVLITGVIGYLLDRTG
jgi:hypothetical protein